MSKGPRDKRMTIDEVVAELRDGMTVGIGGWGPRRKPMALVRAILRSDLTDLTLVSWGGADVGLLVRAGKVRKLVYAFVSLDTIPLEPNFQRARQAGSIPEVVELDEGMFQTGLRAAAQRLPFLPMRAGLGSDVMVNNPQLKTVTSPYAGPDDEHEELVAVPALNLDVALVHLNRADQHGNATYLGPDPYFDDLFCMAAERAFVSCEEIVDTAGLTVDTPVQRLLLSRMMVSGVVETPNGAHFTTCTPDYERDEKFQKAYAAAAADDEAWAAFEERFLSGDEAAYQAAVRAFGEEERGERRRPAPMSAPPRSRTRSRTTARSSPARWACCRCSASGWPGSPATRTWSSPTASRCSCTGCRRCSRRRTSSRAGSRSDASSTWWPTASGT